MAARGLKKSERKLARLFFFAIIEELFLFNADEAVYSSVAFNHLTLLVHGFLRVKIVSAPFLVYSDARPAPASPGSGPSPATRPAAVPGGTRRAPGKRHAPAASAAGQRAVGCWRGWARIKRCLVWRGALVCNGYRRPIYEIQVAGRGSAKRFFVRSLAFTRRLGILGHGYR